MTAEGPDRQTLQCVTFPPRIRYNFTMDDYSHFYKAHKERLYAYLLRMTGDVFLACDLVQESFARYLGRYGHRGGSKSLLYTIARNAALDAIRKQKPGGCDADDCEDPAGNPEKQTIDREAFDRMLAAVGQLAPPDRELISLVATADLSYQEIGKILNISEANVKVRVHRARTKLKTLLDPESSNRR
jgi:RNA polymerase sigma-70 factor, ECF subfamily